VWRKQFREQEQSNANIVVLSMQSLAVVQRARGAGGHSYVVERIDAGENARAIRGAFLGEPSAPSKAVGPPINIEIVFGYSSRPAFCRARRRTTCRRPPIPCSRTNRRSRLMVRARATGRMWLGGIREQDIKVVTSGSMTPVRELSCVI
jgi:hypothetical protein